MERSPFFNKPDALETVSYTHLDVYKRQQVMGVNAIRYTLTKDLKKTLCSKCELFTSKEYSYIPIGQLVSKGGIKAILAYYQTLGPVSYTHLDVYKRQEVYISARA